jgi:D-alanine-D-alanine ligase
MHLVIVHNQDFAHLPAGISRVSQDAVLGVVSAFQEALATRDAVLSTVAVLDASSLSGELFSSADLVVNLCESLGGDARGEMVVPALLELAGVPFTGSGPLSILLCLHKHKAKELLRARGIPTPDWALVERMEDLAAMALPLPAVVKPDREDASIGIDRHSLVHDRAELAWACERVLTERRQPALVERFVDGRELNVALLGAPPQVLPINEIDFTGLDPDHPRIVTYAAKWDESAPEFHTTPPVPCNLSPAQLEQVGQVARQSFEALELRDYGRVDIRLAADGTPFVIEVNPNCDLSPGAGFSKAALAAGLSYSSLVWRIVEIAGSRHARPTAGLERPPAARADARGNRRVPPGRDEVRPGVGPARPG